MSRTAQCTSCGAKVNFRASSSLLAVCEFCKSTLIRNDLNLESLGKMADLLEDHSLLQINTQGRYKGSSFDIIGRVQYQYAAGVWNEWHILFNNGKTGWLSEASGSYVISFAVLQHAMTASVDSYQIKEPVIIAGQQFRVSAIETARCVTGEGELPFKIESGFDTKVVDFSNETSFASLDFSESPPMLFLGEQVELPTLNLTNLRSNGNTQASVKIRTFNCPSCAAPVSININSTQSIVCNSCTAVLDVSNKNVGILRKYQQATHIKPRIELGSVGKLNGIEYRIVGFMRRELANTGLPGYWDEYLLYHPSQGFRWLTEAKGHWNFIKPLQKSPKISTNLINRTPEVFLLKRYKHYEKYQAKVSYVLGEFYWRVALDDAVDINDYIAPPSILTEEKSQKEVNWSQGEYIDYKAIESAFGAGAVWPEPTGSAANQPSPYEAYTAPFIKALAGFMVAGLFIQLFFVLFSSHRLVLDTVANFEQGSSANPFQSEAFKLSGHPSNLVIHQNASLSNDWFGTEITLVEKDSGQRYQASREMSFYSGQDADGYWSEAHNQSEIIFSKIPTGNYTLEVKPYTENNGSSNGIYDNIKVYRDVAQWSNLWILWLVLIVIPLIFFYLRHRFEVKRWQDSDHPIATSE